MLKLSFLTIISDFGLLPKNGLVDSGNKNKNGDLEAVKFQRSNV